MNTPKEKFKNFIKLFSPILPYGVIEPWDDLNPRLYHAIHIYWLKFYGMWYKNFPLNSLYFWLSCVYTAIILWLVCFWPGIGEITYLLERRDNIGDIAEGLYLFLSEMYTYFKVAVFWHNKKKIISLLEYLHCYEFKPKEKEHKHFILKSIKEARFVMTYYTTMCVGAVSVAMIMPIAENFKVLPTNVEYPKFDVYNSPVYGILYAHHIYYKPATCIIDGAMDTILAAFILCAIGQIDCLAYNLRNFIKISDRRLEQDKKAGRPVLSKESYIRGVLKDCITHHCSILKYVSLVEEAFSLASALQFMLSVMVLCLVGVQFLSIESPASHPFQMAWMAIYLTCMLFEVFILCWYGDELIWKSNHLRQAAFDGPWLKTDPKLTKYIIVFLERTQKPMRVTAGKIFTLSLDTYTVLINWSYKAFALMSNLKK